MTGDPTGGPTLGEVYWGVRHPDWPYDTVVGEARALTEAGAAAVGAAAIERLAQGEPQRPTAGLMPMGLDFSDADPVAHCLVKDCRWHGHGDAMIDAVSAWTAHLAKDHRNDWPEDE